MACVWLLVPFPVLFRRPAVEYVQSRLAAFPHLIVRMHMFVCPCVYLFVCVCVCVFVCARANVSPLNNPTESYPLYALYLPPIIFNAKGSPYEQPIATQLHLSTT